MSHKFQIPPPWTQAWGVKLYEVSDSRSPEGVEVCLSLTGRREFTLQQGTAGRVLRFDENAARALSRYLRHNFPPVLDHTSWSPEIMEHISQEKSLTRDNQVEWLSRALMGLVAMPVSGTNDHQAVAEFLLSPITFWQKLGVWTRDMEARNGNTHEWTIEVFRILAAKVLNLLPTGKDTVKLRALEEQHTTLQEQYEALQGTLEDPVGAPPLEERYKALEERLQDAQMRATVAERAREESRNALLAALGRMGSGASREEIIKTLGGVSVTEEQLERAVKEGRELREQFDSMMEEKNRISKEAENADAAYEYANEKLKIVEKALQEETRKRQDLEAVRNYQQEQLVQAQQTEYLLRERVQGLEKAVEHYLQKDQEVLGHLDDLEVQVERLVEEARKRTFLGWRLKVKEAGEDFYVHPNSLVLVSERPTYVDRAAINTSKARILAQYPHLRVKLVRVYRRAK